MASIKQPHILGVNPWIHDFAAYDFWSKPLGLLSLLAVLRAHGYHVSYIDCTDRFHPQGPKTDPSARCGRGPYRKTRLPAPDGLETVPRHFSRYGIDPAWLREDLKSLPKPDLILVTSIMTYWYPGVEETIAIIKQVFPRVPVVLGGVYAALCTDHAEKNSGADWIATGISEKNILSFIEDKTDYPPDDLAEPAFDPENMDTWPWPAHDLQRRTSCVPLLTSRGCPFHCPYCASRFLDPVRVTRSPLVVAGEVAHWHHEHGVRDFVFYDDALLINSDEHFIPLAEKICATLPGLRFHTPNALHIREINQTTARWMFQCGFETIRLGLETAAFADREKFDDKVTQDEFERAVSCLKAAGFSSRQIGAYVLAGLPGQSTEDVNASLRFVSRRGIIPIPAYYTPIPHTALWADAVASSPYDLAADPIFTNNALFPCRPEGFSWEGRARVRPLADMADFDEEPPTTDTEP